MHDIQHLTDVEILVNTFYDRIRKDELLGPIFNERLEHRWDEHIEKLVRFWQTILLGEHTYHGYPFHPHATMPISETHFSHWINLFHSTVNDLFQGPVAEEAKNRGKLMAGIFQHKLDYLNQHRAS
jgi:hemoglobin